MIELTGKAKRHLRGLGQTLAPAAVVGKAGVTPATAAQVRRLLAQRELVKVRIPAGRTAARKATAARLADAAGAVCVGVVGRTALLYRPDEGLDPQERISLP